MALHALQLRLRSAQDAPGDVLPIQLIAEALRLSTTPVREALSRLAGERLVEKRGHAYTRPRLDADGLAELYRLRLLYVLAALAPRADAGDRRTWPPRPVLALRTDLVQGARTAAEVMDLLQLELVLRADDLMLAEAFQMASERIAPFLPVEAVLLPDQRAEALGLIAAFDTGDLVALRARLRHHKRRRSTAASTIVRLAEAHKYRSHII